MTRVFASVSDLEEAIGTHLGYSNWIVVDQARIDAFAAATGDDQWIHVDPVRAAAGPFGATVAHGYLTMALVPGLVATVLEYSGWASRVNYGSDKVRFPSPVLVDSRIRAGVELLGVRPVGAGLQVTNRVTVEIERAGLRLPRPALVAETITFLTP